MRLLTRLLPLAILLALPGHAEAQSVDQCPSGQTPHYVFGFADLKAHIGAPMGDPTTCEFADPNGTGDVHQRTSTGLAFWRKSTNTPTFTDGWRHWALTPQGWVDWVGTSIDPPRSANSSTTTFLKPPPGLAPFANLPVGAIEADSASWRIIYGNPGGSSVVISGQAGMPIQQVFSRCTNTALYCTENVLGRDDTRPASEIFRGLSVQGQQAFVTHVTCCNGLYWIVNWYNPANNTGYTLSFEQDQARPFGESIAPGNVASARQLASIADQLMPAAALQ